jgi:hypothetical protein
MTRNAAATRRRELARTYKLIADVCDIAGDPCLISDARRELAEAGVAAAIRAHRNGPIFEWLVEAANYQGVSNAAAAGYTEAHGHITYRQIADATPVRPACAKLTNWWHFNGCGYRKIARTCNAPTLTRRCALPRLDMRNGSLNQTAFGLYLFMRDVAQNDFVRWLDRTLSTENSAVAVPAASVIAQMREIHGLSDKVLNMCMSMLLLAGDPDRRTWVSAGTNMIATDTLVHNWFERTGILKRLGARHTYGPTCYRDDGCAELIMRAARRIDARRFNPAFPPVFPRFVQHAIWRFCAQSGLAQCNSVAIPTDQRCRDRECALFARCDRLALTTL